MRGILDAWLRIVLLFGLGNAVMSLQVQSGLLLAVPIRAK